LLNLRIFNFLNITYSNSSSVYSILLSSSYFLSAANFLAFSNFYALDSVANVKSNAYMENSSPFDKVGDFYFSTSLNLVSFDILGTYCSLFYSSSTDSYF
jgi:hypothetical protein